MESANYDELVTPVETGVQDIYKSWKNWIPAFAGMTGNLIFRFFTRSSNFTANFKYQVENCRTNEFFQDNFHFAIFIFQ